MIINKSKQGTYYLGRVILIGNIDKNTFIEAMKYPVSIAAGEYSWTITEFKDYRENGHSFIFGRLTKYQPQGEVDVVDVTAHVEKTEQVDNTKIASSPFVYLPDYSGIAYLHVWNKIEQETFVRRFTALIKEKYQDFMVDCEIEAITDLGAFYKRISSLVSIDLVSVKVRPPNPLFGPLWKSLKEYLQRRKVAQLKLEEKATKDEKLNTNIKELILNAEKESAPSGQDTPDITDAAILMATDGYGQGKVVGVEGKRKVTIHTSESVKNFKFDSEPDPIKLYEIADVAFKEISEKRHMEHDKKD